MIQTFKCSVCRKVYPSGSYKLSEDNQPICYICSATHDRNQMLKTGKATLYVDEKLLVLKNFPGTLSLKIEKMNITRTTGGQTIKTVWFTLDNRVWKGAAYGHNPTCYCERLPRVELDVSGVQGLLHRLQASLPHKTRKHPSFWSPVTVLRLYK